MRIGDRLDAPYALTIDDYERSTSVVVVLSNSEDFCFGADSAACESGTDEQHNPEPLYDL